MGNRWNGKGGKDSIRNRQRAKAMLYGGMAGAYTNEKGQSWLQENVANDANFVENSNQNQWQAAAKDYWSDKRADRPDDAYLQNPAWFTEGSIPAKFNDPWSYYKSNEYKNSVQAPTLSLNLTPGISTPISTGLSTPTGQQPSTLTGQQSVQSYDVNKTAETDWTKPDYSWQALTEAQKGKTLADPSFNVYDVPASQQGLVVSDSQFNLFGQNKTTKVEATSTPSRLNPTGGAQDVSIGFGPKGDLQWWQPAAFTALSSPAAPYVQAGAIALPALARGNVGLAAQAMAPALLSTAGMAHTQADTWREKAKEHESAGNPLAGIFYKTIAAFTETAIADPMDMTGYMLNAGGQTVEQIGSVIDHASGGALSTTDTSKLAGYNGKNLDTQFISPLERAELVAKGLYENPNNLDYKQVVLGSFLSGAMEFGDAVLAPLSGNAESMRETAKAGAKVAFGLLGKEEDAQHGGDLWQAGKVYYETLGSGKGLVDSADVESLLTLKNGGTAPTKQEVDDLASVVNYYLPLVKNEGDVWVTGEAKAHAVKPGYTMDDAIRKLEEGASPEQLMQEYQAAYGLSGVATDFAIQSFADPYNVLDGATSKVMESGSIKIGEINERKAQRIIDSVPEGQALSEAQLAKVTEYKARAEIAQTKARVYGSTSSANPIAEINPFSETARKMRAEFQSGTVSNEARQHLNYWEKKIAGLDESGRVIKELTPADTTLKGIPKAVQFVFSLNPESKAKLFSNKLSGLIRDLTTFKPGITPREQINLVKAAAALDMPTLKDAGAEFLAAPEAYTVINASRDLVRKMEGEVNRHEKMQGARERALAVWEALGKDNGLFRRGLTPDEFAKLKADPNLAPDLRKAIDTGAASYKSISREIKLFTRDQADGKGGTFRNALNDAEFTHVLNDLAYEHMKDWGAEYFGVKKANVFEDGIRMLKGVQSLVLLDLSPSSILNDLINERVMLMTAGTFGFTPDAKMQAHFDAMGMDKPTGQGVLGDLPTIDGDPISDARKSGGWLGKVADKVNKARQYMPRSLITSKTNEAHTRQVMYSESKKVISRLWEVGKSIDRMPPSLEARLRSAGIDPKAVYQHIKGTLDPRSMADFTKRTAAADLHAYLEDADAQTGSEAGSSRAMLDQLGVLDTLQAGLEKAKTPAERVKVFDSVEYEAMKSGIIRDAEYTKQAVQRYAQKFKTEGILPGMQHLFGKIASEFYETKLKVTDTWERAYAEAERHPEIRGAILEKASREADYYWQHRQLRESAMYTAAIEGANLNTDFGRKYLALVAEEHSTLRKFFEDKRRDARKIMDSEYDPAAWEAHAQKFNERFDKEHGKLLDNQKKRNDLFVKEFAGKYGPKAKFTAQAWADGTHTQMMKLHEMIVEFRSWVDNAANMPSEFTSIREWRDSEWREFNKAYTSEYQKLTRADMLGAADLHKHGDMDKAEDINARLSEAERAANLDDAGKKARVDAVWEVAKDFGKTPDNSADKFSMLPTLQKYGDPEIKGLWDEKVTPELVRSALENQRNAHDERRAGIDSRAAERVKAKQAKQHTARRLLSVMDKFKAEIKDIRKNGWNNITNVDAMAELLHENQYLTDLDIQNPDDTGGMKKAQELIDAAIRGEDVKAMDAPDVRESTIKKDEAAWAEAQAEEAAAIRAEEAQAAAERVQELKADLDAYDGAILSARSMEELTALQDQLNERMAGLTDDLYTIDIQAKEAALYEQAYNRIEEVNQPADAEIVQELTPAPEPAAEAIQPTPEDGYTLTEETNAQPTDETNTVGYAAMLEKIAKEKPGKNGYTKTQSEYIAQKLKEWAVEVSKADGPGELAKVSNGKGTYPIRNEGDYLTITVPGGGSITITDYRGANNLHHVLTGKAIVGWEDTPRGMTYRNKNKTPKMEAQYDTADYTNAALRLYGDPQKAYDTITRQIETTGIDASSETLSVLAELRDMAAKTPKEIKVLVDLANNFKKQVAETVRNGRGDNRPTGKMVNENTPGALFQDAERVQAQIAEEIELRKIYEAGSQAKNDMAQAEYRAKAINTRDDYANKLREAFGDKADTYMVVPDALANVYAKTTGKTVDEFYAKYWDDISKMKQQDFLDSKSLGQTGNQKYNGVYDPSEKAIRAFENANFTTLVHENAHVFEVVLKDMAKVDRRFSKDLHTIEKWLGVEGGSKWTVEHKEAFAEGYERYAAEGRRSWMPEGLADAFDSFEKWMLEVYKGLKKSPIEMTDEVRAVFDRMLKREDTLQQLLSESDPRQPAHQQLRDAWERLSPDQHREAIGWLADQTMIDPLSGLETLVAKSLAEKPAGWVDATTDLNALKFINDTWGHEGGDAAIAELGKIAKEETERAGGRAFRVGGDENSYWFPNEEATKAALDAIDKRYQQLLIDAGGERRKGFSVSYGYGETFKAADAMLYNDKERRAAIGQRAARGEMPASIRAQESAKLYERFKTAFGENADTYIVIPDAMAKWYEKTTGKSADTFYARYAEQIARDTGAAFEAQDYRGVIRKSAEVFSGILRDVNKNSKGGAVIKEHLRTVENWLGVEGGNWTDAHHEAFVDGFQKYVSGGSLRWMPNGLAQAFASFKDWMHTAYGKIRGKNIAINTDVRRIFDQALGASRKAVSDANGVKVYVGDKVNMGGEAYEAIDVLDGKLVIYRKGVTATVDPRKFEAANVKPLFQTQEDQPVWYSKLARTIEGIQQASMTVEQLRGQMKSAGVKSEEMFWTGFDDYLASKQPGEKVSKAEALKYVQDNQVEIKEITKSEAMQKLNRDAQERIWAAEEAHGNAYAVADKIFNETIDMLKRNNVPDAFEIVRDMYYDGEEAGSIAQREAAWEKLSEYQAQSAEVRDYDYNAMHDANLEVDKAAQDLEIERSVAEAWDKTDNATKFDQYALPGGDNYREVLFTLPSTAAKSDLVKLRAERMRLSSELSSTLQNDAKHQEIQDKIDEANNKFLDAENMADRNHYKNVRDKYEAELEQYVKTDQPLTAGLYAQLSEIDKKIYREKIKDEGNDYHSGHWGEPNILAHTRLNDRIDADGKRVLFVEEVQSDWHQAGRDKGYQQNYTPETLPDNYATRYRASDDRIILFKDGEQLKDFANIDDAVDWVNKAGVPAAPFAKTWHEFVIKRVLRMAAEGGYERVAWTTGAQQAARYDLAQQVDYVTSERNADGTYNADAIKGGRSLSSQQNMTAQALAGAFGKDLAQKMIDAPDGSQKWEGENLSVGGEGMKGFYDNMIPSYLDKYAKKWGAKSGGTSIGLPAAGENSNMARVAYEDDQYVLEKYDADADEWNQSEWYDTAEEADQAADLVNKGDATPVHSIDVTDAMRTSVMEGQPLFQQAYSRIEGGQERSITAEDAANYARMLVRAGEGELRRAIRNEANKADRVAILDAAHNINASMAENVARGERDILFQQPTPEGDPLDPAGWRSPDKMPTPEGDATPAPAFEGEDADYSEKPIYPPGGYDQTSGHMDFNEMYTSGWYDKVKPALAAMKESALAPDRKYNYEGIDPQTSRELNQYLIQQGGNLQNAKIASRKWAEAMRDYTLLDYNRQYGFDKILSAAVPYEFFGTRSMMTWAARVMDHPQWLAHYARLNKLSQTYESQLPERTRGKLFMPMPFLPQWAGGGVFFDPKIQLFPFTQFAQPIQAMQRDQQNAENSAVYILRNMADDKEITAEQATEAFTTRTGDLWQKALKQAQAESGNENTGVDYFSMLFGPALYATLPYYLATGKQMPNPLTGNKVQSNYPSGQLPITRAGQALETAFKGTGAEWIGNIAGLLAKPEKALRDAKGLSEFGEYGDYYIDRQLANMAAEGTDIEDVQIAMIERKGELYDKAVDRVKLELAMRVPGINSMYGAAHGATFDQVVGSLIPSLFSNGILPPAEMEYKGLKNEYGLAWEAKKNGNDDAINKFFDAHPEYQARLALRKDPEERLNQFMRSQIWEKYYELGKTNQNYAMSQMEGFDNFKDANTYKKMEGAEAEAFLEQNPDFAEFLQANPDQSFSTEQLATWAQQLNAAVPATPETQKAIDTPAEPIKIYQQDTTEITDKFFADRTANYPNYWSEQGAFYALAKSDQPAYLANHPKLKEYWTWKDAYYKKYPELVPVMKGETNKSIDTSTWNPVLVEHVSDYAYGGKKMTSAEMKAITQIWVREGRPMGDVKDWIDREVVPSLLYGGK